MESEQDISYLNIILADERRSGRQARPCRRDPRLEGTRIFLLLFMNSLSFSILFRE